MKQQTRNNWLTALGIGAAVAAALWTTRRGSYDLRGRVVLITGGSRGLGLVLARQAAAEGAKVAIVARDPAELERARLDLEAHNAAEVLTLVHDLSDENAVRTMVTEVNSQLGPIDVLINNAGIITGGPLEHMQTNDYRELMDIHFWATLHATQAVLPHMRRRGEGRIINITSIGGKVPVPHLAPYCASKYAMVGLSESFRVELLQHGVYVTTVCPGLMRTGSPRQAIVKGQHELEFAWFKVAGSMPGLTVSAEYAATQIWNAARRGDAELILSLPAKILARLHGLAPSTFIDVMSLVNRVLPSATGTEGDDRQRGFESESAVSKSWLTALTQKAERENNELGNHSPYPA